MKKLKLEIDALRVESFKTDEAKEERGTVHGNASSGGGGGGFECLYGCVNPATSIDGGCTMMCGTLSSCPPWDNQTEFCESGMATCA